MIHGVYRNYFHIGKIGFKIARFDWSNTNAFCGFLAGIIMNLLERRRYKYYVLRKSYKQWDNTWTYLNKTDIRLAPCYFSCGLFNIVKHLPYNVQTWKGLSKIYHVESFEDEWNEKTAYLLDDIKLANFRRDVDGKVYYVDYCNFNLTYANRMNVLLIDYK